VADSNNEASSELTLRVTPRSSRNLLEWNDGDLKAWVSAAPTDGQANEAVIKLLAHRLGIAPSKITLLRGTTSRIKHFRIDGLTKEAVLARLTSD
jgi:uncharacterized protein YggU (UPF0235/DUF167 family)